MLVLESLIAARLRALPEFVGWQVREGCDDVSRISIPAADVRMSGASIPQVRKPAASVQPEWVVTLVVQRCSTAAQQLDSAFKSVMGALHNWRPVDPSGRSWTELQVARVRPADFADVALVGYEVSFTTVAVFDGQN